MTTNNKKTKKRGRPKLAKQELQSQIVPIRFRTDELKLAQQKATARNLTLSEWIREAVREKRV